MVIFSRFRATLGRCSDEKSQAVEELSAAADSLRAQLIEAKLKSGGEKIAERKALIASWRTLVEKATREYWDTGERGFHFPRILESQEGYMTLSPHLPPETKLALYNARHDDDSDISNLVEMLADDIAQVERDWQV